MRQKRPSFLFPIFLLLVCAMVGSLVAAGCRSSEDGATETLVRYQQSEPCNLPPEGWEQWRDEQIAAMLTPSEGGRHYLEVSVVASRARAIFERIEACEKSEPALLAEEGPAGRLLKNLKRFSAAIGLYSLEDHHLEMTITDLEYINYARKEIELPDLLKSQEFLKKVSDPSTYRNAYEMIEVANKKKAPGDRWVVLIYKGQFILTPDNTTYGRFFILVPGNPTTKWIQFGIVTPDMKEETIHSMSIVSARFTGRDDPKTEVYLADYWREYSDEGIRLVTNVESHHTTGQCYSCHKTPVLPIRPAVEYTFDPSGALVPKTKKEHLGDIPDHLNNLIPGYGRPYFGGYLDTMAYGPPLGPFGRNRSDAFLEKCSASSGVAPSAFPRLRTYMNCSMCHNSGFLGNVGYPLATHTDLELDAFAPFHPLLETSIREGWMPPSTESVHFPEDWVKPEEDLSPPERKALANCLMMEYFDPANGSGLLVDWLENRDTSGADQPTESEP